jgi:hypothetical protein
MIETIVSQLINAPICRVFSLYADPENWPHIFPAIRSVRILSESEGKKVIEVDHIHEGRVINRMHRVSESRIDLEEFKPHYEATFINQFDPEPAGTRYTLTAMVRLKGFYRVAAPFVKPVVLDRMRRYVLIPMKIAAESGLRTEKRPSTD